MPLNALADFALLSAIWGASFLFMLLALPEFGPLPTAAGRVGLAALFLLPMVWMRGQMPLLRLHWRATLLVGVFNSGIPFALYCFALLSISTGLSAILNATTPMFGALVAWAWLKDRPNASRSAGLVIGFAGVAMLASQKATLPAGASGLSPVWAVLACLGACLCYGIAASYTKRYLGGLPALVTATGSQIGATLALALPALWLAPTRLPGTSAWLALAAAAALCTGVAYILYFRLVERIGPARSLTVTFLVPVFALFYGAVFLQERVTVWMLACGVVIVLGTALSTGLVALPRRQPAGAKR